MRHWARRRGEFSQSRNSDRLTRFDAVAGARPLAINTDAPGAQQLLELAMTQCRIMALEPAVEPEPAVPAIHRQNLIGSRHLEGTALRWRSLSQYSSRFLSSRSN